MCKNRIANLIIIFVMVLFAAILGVSTVQIAYAEATINYQTTIKISCIEEGRFAYGNDGGPYKESDDLQSIFDEINANIGETGKNPEIEFINVVTDKKIILNYTSRIFVLNGNVTYTGGNETSFITVNSGTLRTTGGDFQSMHATLIKINEGATLETSGTFTVNGAVWPQNVATVVNDGGMVKMTGGKIGSENTDKVTGIAYYQSGNGRIEMSGGYVVGQIAMFLQSGTAVLSGGTIDGIRLASEADNAGISLQVFNAAKVELSGTTIENSAERIAVSFEGNGEGEIRFIGGVVKGRIMLSKTSAGGYGGYVYVNGRKIRKVTEGRIFLYSDDGELTVDNGRLGFIGDNQEGYYLSSWNDDPTKGKNPLLSSFADGELITPNLSKNMYEITVVVGEKTKRCARAYGSLIDLSDENDDCYMAAPDGYTVAYWSDGSNTGTAFRVTGEMTLTATLSLLAPVIGEMENLSCPYDGTTHTISAAVNEISGLAYGYLWEKFDESSGTWTEYCNSETMSVKNHSDSGKYRLTVEVDDGERKNSARSSEIIVNVDRIDYYGITHRGLSGTYNAAYTLSDYQLDTGFYWEDENIVPTVPQTEYNAKYCLDKDNYNEFSLKISLILNKAACVESTHRTVTGDYVYDPDKTLADYPFEESEWRWKDTSTVPRAGQNAYEAYHNPDRDNYEDYLIAVQIDIAKANYNGIENLLISVNYSENITAGKAFDDSGASRGYRINAENRSVKLEQVKIYEFGGYYNADADNYNDFAVTVFIDVGKGNYSEIYYGNDNTVEGGAYREGKRLSDIPLNDDFYWVDGDLLVSMDNDGYEAYYNADPDRYNNYRLILKISMQKGEVPIEDRISIEPITGVYSPVKTLADYPLPDGFAWHDETYVPVVSDDEYCTAVFLETDRYLSYSVDVKIELRKADYDLSKAVFADKTVAYDGKEHGIVIEGVLPDGVSVLYYEGTGKFVGEYTIRVFLAQEDTANYNVIGSLSAMLVIEKGEYDMSGVIFADDSVVYDGKAHTLVVSGSLPDGVTVSGYSAEGYINSGSYVITVAFSQEDSDNYKKVNELSATLTIEKAQCVFLGETEQREIYDGTNKKPRISVNNDEQTVFDDANDGYSDFGRYKVKFYTNESMNYLRGEITVDFDIIGYEIESEKESIVSVYDLNSAQSGTLTVESESAEKSLTVTLLLNGKEQEGLFGIKIEIPESFRGKDVKVDYVTTDGKRIACDAKEEDGYLWLSVNKLGKFDIYVGETDGNDEEIAQWWVWLIIGLSCAIVAGGLAVVAVVLIKRKKATARAAANVTGKVNDAIPQSDEIRDRDTDKGDNDGE